MSFFESLVTWANLPFTAAIATVLTFAALQATGVLGLLAGGEGDHDADGGHDADADADHDAGASDGDHDADHDTDQDAGGKGGTGLLATVGFGRLPTTIVWQTFAICFGLVGILANTALHALTSSLHPGALLVSLPLGLVGGFGLAAGVVRVVVKVVKPPSEAPGKRDLVGLPGVVVSGQVDDQFGEVRVKARTGDFVQVACRVLPGEPPIEHHASIVIVQYDRSLDRVFVTAAPGDSPDAPPARARVSS